MKNTLLLILSILILSCGDKSEQINKEISNFIKSENIDKSTIVFNIRCLKTEDGYKLEGIINSQELKDKLSSSLVKLNTKITDETSVVPTKELEDKIWGVVDISVANIRLNPGLGQEMASQTTLGTVVKILTTKKDWYLIQTPDNYLGWVHPKAIVRMTKTEVDQYLMKDKLIVTSRIAFAYKSAKFKEVVTDIIDGNILELTSKVKNNYEIKLPSGEIAFVKKQDVMPFKEWQDSRILTQDAVVNTAKEFMGIHYLWGGTSIKGLDCSGFVKTVYYKHGLILQRDASQQNLYGKDIDISKIENLNKGDLLFFGRIRNNQKRITHVGMYIGDSEYIHCASSRVRINSFDTTRDNYNEDLKSRFFFAKTILNNIDNKGIVKISESNLY
jgi:uncharacterized protein YgiM (DUF1202 family)